MRVLFLTHRLPYAPNRGDRIRAYYLLQELARFARVSLFSLVHDEAEEAAAARRLPGAAEVRVARSTPLRNHVLGAARLPGRTPLTHSLLDAPAAAAAIAALAADARPDLVLAYCSGMARFALAPPLDALPLVLDLVDVDSQKWRQMAERSRGPIRWVYRREAATLSRFEARAALRARTTMVVTDREASLLEALAPDASIAVVGNGIDLDRFAPPGPPADGETVVFTGLMSYGPNEQGVLWFVEHVWARVRAARPRATLLVVGAEPTAAIRRRAARDSSIAVTGQVDAVTPYLWQSAVAIAPLHLARGLQNKVLEALAAGLPVVATSAVLDGLPSAARAGCRPADAAEAFADGVIDLLSRAPEDRRRQAAAADLRDLTWAARLHPLGAILHAACTRRSNASGK